MNGSQVRECRKRAGLTQEHLAARLGCSQGYLSLMETGRRPVSAELQEKLVRALSLSATFLPVQRQETPRSRDGMWFRERLGELGYPGFRYLDRAGRPTLNPVELLLSALSARRSDPRVFSALPWLLLKFGVRDRDALVERARNHNVQNRLGFVVSVARDAAAAEQVFNDRVSELNALLEALEPYRLAATDDLGQEFKTESYVTYVRENRTPVAAHWNLLTTMASHGWDHGL